MRPGEALAQACQRRRATNSETYFGGPSGPPRPAGAHYFGCQPRPYRICLALFLSAGAHALNCVGAAAASFGRGDTCGDAESFATSPGLSRQACCDVHGQSQNGGIEEKSDNSVQRNKPPQSAGFDRYVGRLRRRADRCRKIEEIPIIGLLACREDQAGARIATMIGAVVIMRIVKRESHLRHGPRYR